MIPHDLDAELHVIACCILRKDAVAQLSNDLEPSDFYHPSHAASFAAILDLWQAGDAVDAHSVSRKAPKGLTAAEITSAVAAVPSTHNFAGYARTISEHSARRRLLAVAAELTEMASGDVDPTVTVDTAVAALDSVELPSGRLPDDLSRLSDLMSKSESDQAPWVVPGLLRQDWRVVVVAPEGSGKSLALQQIGIAAAQGVHPFSFQPCPPVRVLFVDLENPEERIRHGAQMIDPHVRREAYGYDEDRVWIWNRPGGINLRSRSDRSTLETVLHHLHPQLVCLGPAYKTSQKDKGEGWDDAALAAQRILDQLRTRFKFALLMEDHAPQSSGGLRDLRPFGSSMWLRWPEIGLKLIPDDADNPRKLTLGRWRGDRIPNGWPAELDRGDSWPWVGVWHGQIPRYEEAA